MPRRLPRPHGGPGHLELLAQRRPHPEATNARPSPAGSPTDHACVRRLTPPPSSSGAAHADRRAGPELRPRHPAQGQVRGRRLGGRRGRPPRVPAVAGHARDAQHALAARPRLGSGRPARAARPRGAGAISRNLHARRAPSPARGPAARRVRALARSRGLLPPPAPRSPRRGSRARWRTSCPSSRRRSPRWWRASRSTRRAARPRNGWASE